MSNESTKLIKEEFDVGGSCSLKPSTLEKYPNKYFIETGTYKGGGIRSAYLAGFRNIISIEINEDYYEDLRERFKNTPEVKLVLGNSAEMLHLVLQDINESATIFLDAHRLTADEFIEISPLLKEIEAIKDHHIKTHTIIVDDMHKADSGMADWEGASTPEIIAKLKEINSNYLMEYEDGGGVSGRQLVARLEDDDTSI